VDSRQYEKSVWPPAPPPGAPKRQDIDSRLSHLPDGRLNTYNGQPPNARFNDKGQRILPGGGGGARFIPPEEYKEFLQLGHGGIFDLDLDCIDVAPWRQPSVEQSSYFNYGFDERKWRKYVKGIRKARMEQHLNNKIETYTIEPSYVDIDLPVEVRRAMGGWEYVANSEDGSSVQLAHENEKNHAQDLQGNRYNDYNERYGTSDQQRKMVQVAGSEAASDKNLKLLKATQRTDVIGKDENANCGEEVDFFELKNQLEIFQREYRQLLQLGTLTPEKNLMLQQQVLKLKMRMIQYVK